MFDTFGDFFQGFDLALCSELRTSNVTLLICQTSLQS